MVRGEFYTCELIMKYKQPFIRFFGRDENKNSLVFDVRGHKPYFYCLESEANIALQITKEVEPDYVSLFNEKLCRVYIDNPFDIKGTKTQPGVISNFSKTFEADVPYATRYLIDNNIYSGIEFDGQKVYPADVSVEPRIMNLDIETEYYGGSNSDMSQPIISISFYDNYTKRIYCLAYHKDTKPSQTTSSYESQIIKDVDGNKEKLEIINIICTDEMNLLSLFQSYVVHLDVNIFTGWNVNFDLMYICKRMEALQLNPEKLSPIGKYYYKEDYSGNDSSKSGKYKRKERNVIIRGRAIIDILKGYRRIKWKQVESFKLDSVAKKEFNIGKVEYDGWIGNFWKNHFDTFLEYNRRDVEMCEAINRKYSVVSSLLGIRQIAGSELADVLYNSKTLDTYILRYCKDKFILPTKTYSNTEVHASVEGGFVLEPKVGLHRNVVILDLKALYPNIMLAFNISPETVSTNGELHVGNGVHFKKETGILTEILINLGKKRDELRALLKTPEVFNNKDKYNNIYKRQYLFKTFTNSAYGVTLFPGFRLYNPAMGASITYVGRFLANKIRELCEGKGFQVIRQDTDSAFVNVYGKNAEESIKIGKELESEINKSFCNWFKDANIDYSYFSIKFEKLYGLMFSGEEKKLYAGRVIWNWESGEDDELEIKGFASVKTDRSQFSRNLQRTIFEKILYEVSEFNVLDFIYSEINKVYDKKYGYDYLGIPKAITKDIEDYGVENPWIRGVKWSMNNLKGFEFSPKPLLLYIKPSSKYQTDCICFNNEREVPADIQIDYEKMLEATAYKIIEKQLIMLKINPLPILYQIRNKSKGQTQLFSSPTALGGGQQAR